MRWLLVLLLVGLLLPFGSAETCRVGGPDGYVEHECDGDDGGGWDALDVTLGIVALLLSIAGGIFAFIKVRQNRMTVGRYLQRVEAAYARARADPSHGLPDLVGLRSEVRQHYTKGRLEDAPFLELEKRVTQYIGRLRLKALDDHVPSLPKTVLSEAEKLLADGFVSGDDVAEIATKASRSRLASDQKKGLVGLFESWSREDAPLLVG